jgi:hypothetical protein
MFHLDNIINQLRKENLNLREEIKRIKLKSNYLNTNNNTSISKEEKNSNSNSNEKSTDYSQHFLPKPIGGKLFKSEETKIANGHTSTTAISTNQDKSTNSFISDASSKKLDPAELDSKSNDKTLTNKPNG